ncbi:MAG: thioredoxin-dependent thiol peroxidase [Acidobacteria bacterium]|nr:thioredoxin-dependent thiol peroxidase [Acidobacteriota bacterium]
MALLEPGAKAPQFALPDQDGVVRALADCAGQPVVLFFYPKDATPGCTTEACGFQDALPDFSRAGAVVFGISILDTASKATFARRHGLAYPLLADEDHAVCERYGVWQEKRLYGRTFMGIARTTYLVAPDGTVARRWDGVKVDAHAADVLAVVEGAERR